MAEWNLLKNEIQIFVFFIIKNRPINAFVVGGYQKLK